jgi:curved DNA-binding protein CbpA
MINGKTFYQVLGVLEDAEQVVIRAAYRALSQKYHPDKVQNEMAPGSPRMADINRAYDTLSDPAKRAEYDAYLSSIGGKNDTSQLNDDAEDGVDDQSFDKAWEIAKEFYPKIESEYNRLRKTNKKLAFAFKAILLDHKIYEMSGEIAEKLETGFLKQYFGEDPEILEFARQLIHSGNRELAKELNKIVSIMGKSVSLGQIKKTFEKRFGQEERNQRAAEMRRAQSVREIVQAIANCRGDLRNVELSEEQYFTLFNFVDSGSNLRRGKEPRSDEWWFTWKGEAYRKSEIELRSFVFYVVGPLADIMLYNSSGKE